MYNVQVKITVEVKMALIGTPADSDPNPLVRKSEIAFQGYPGNQGPQTYTGIAEALIRDAVLDKSGKEKDAHPF